MSVTVKLTGRTRHRVHKPFFGAQLLVLQVEEQRQGYSAGEMHGDGVDVDFCQWRDARPEDITTRGAP